MPERKGLFQLAVHQNRESQRQELKEQVTPPRSLSVDTVYKMQEVAYKCVSLLNYSYYFKV